MTSPLSGVRVLDFTRVIAGPLATQHLADLGATVIKVEDPVNGDDVRGRDGKKAGRSSFFRAFNRSKQSIGVDLKAEAGREVILRLAASCDVLIENFRPGVMGRLGLDHETVRAVNPRLIYVSISAYGQTGSMSDRPGFDPVLQAESGMMALTGRLEDPPTRHPLSIVDIMTAQNAVGAILASLFARERTGQGEVVDLSLYDTSILALSNAALGYLTTGQMPERSGNAHMQSTPTDLFETGTEPMYIVAGNDRIFRRFCNDVLDLPELPTDERFGNVNDRRANRDALKTIIEGRLKTAPLETWLSKARHLPAGPVRGMDAALSAPETLERDLVVDIADPEGSMRLLGSPYKLKEHELATFEPPPHLGSSTRAALERVGYEPDEIDELVRQGVLNDGRDP